MTIATKRRRPPQEQRRGSILKERCSYCTSRNSGVCRHAGGRRTSNSRLDCIETGLLLQRLVHPHAEAVADYGGEEPGSTHLADDRVANAELGRNVPRREETPFPQPGRVVVEFVGSLDPAEAHERDRRASPGLDPALVEDRDGLLIGMLVEKCLELERSASCRP